MHLTPTPFPTASRNETSPNTLRRVFDPTTGAAALLLAALDKPEGIIVLVLDDEQPSAALVVTGAPSDQLSHVLSILVEEVGVCGTKRPHTFLVGVRRVGGATEYDRRDTDELTVSGHELDDWMRAMSLLSARGHRLIDVVLLGTNAFGSLIDSLGLLGDDDDYRNTYAERSTTSGPRAATRKRRRPRRRRHLFRGHRSQRTAHR